MKNYMVGYYREVRPKGELCSCGHSKDSHSSTVSGDTICYGVGSDGHSANCKCGCAYPSRIRLPKIGTQQEVNLNLKKPQFRPNRVQARIIGVHKAEKVYHRNYGENAFVLCTVELDGGKQVLAFSEWVNED